MLLIIFFVLFAISQYLASLAIGVGSVITYTYSKFERISLISMFLICAASIFILPYFENISWIIELVIIIAIFILCTILAIFKKVRVDKYKEEVQLVYEIFKKIVDKKGVGLNYNELPFELSYRYDSICKIDVKVEPTAFNENVVQTILPQLNAFITSFTWNYELHLDKRYISFIGSDKPPNFAKWPGSDLQHFNYFPMGISGSGEVGWYLDSVPKGRLNKSQFLGEDGKPIEINTKLPRQPQGLVAGATGGGKSIYINQEIYD